mmetsp:Transcript_2042/g.6283  ORF Transcript_2042/g.6283 Transcript_2042/m.6283 type:complete len:168 (-) Transcript_2042:40-543(-)
MQQQRRLLDELLGPDRNDLPKEDRRRGRRGKLRFKVKKAEGVGSLKRRGKALGSETNAGVSLRNSADLLELEVEERRKSEALERKARLYDKITRGEVEPPSDYQVNFKAKGTAPPPPPPRLSEPSRKKPRPQSASKLPGEDRERTGSAKIAALKAKAKAKQLNKITI